MKAVIGSYSNFKWIIIGFLFLNIVLAMNYANASPLGELMSDTLGRFGIPTNRIGLILSVIAPSTANAPEVRFHHLNPNFDKITGLDLRSLDSSISDAEIKIKKSEPFTPDREKVETNLEAFRKAIKAELDLRAERNYPERSSPQEIQNGITHSQHQRKRAERGETTAGREKQEIEAHRRQQQAHRAFIVQHEHSIAARQQQRIQAISRERQEELQQRLSHEEQMRILREMQREEARRHQDGTLQMEERERQLRGPILPSPR